MKHFLLVWIGIALAPLGAQESVRQWWGGMIGWSWMDHRARIPVYEGQPECGEFTRGRSTGLMGAITYDREMLPWFEISARVAAWQRPARLELLADNGLEAFDPDQNAYVPFVRRHVWNANVLFVGVELSSRLYPVRLFGGDIPLWLRLGADVAYPAFGADYEQTEEIVQPRAVLFPDGTRRHVIARGAIEDVATALGGIGAIGMRILLRPQVELLPEIGIRYGLTSLRSNHRWDVHTVFAALGVRFDFDRPPEEPLPPPPPPPPPPPAEPTVLLDLALPEPVRIQETVVTETFPLLPYVFFDSASSVLPARYMPLVEEKTFADSMLPRSTLGIYYHLLHILGRRLAADSSAVLTITGTTDGAEVPAPQQVTLARARAEAVAAYLRSHWQLRPHQLVITTAPAPSMPSNPAYPEGMAENRRVELSSSTIELFSPIVHERFREYLVQRRRIALRLKSPIAAVRWEIQAFYGATVLGYRHGDGPLPEHIALDLDSAALEQIAASISSQDSIPCELRAWTATGQVLTGKISVPIERTLSKFERSRLSLVVFDFDRADLSPSNREMVRRFVLAAVKPPSRIRITGSTDRLGEAAYNVRLSQARADEARQFIEHLVPSARIEEARGVGPSRLLFDNALPEGRYYCRTVTILVETPMSSSKP
ncbi:MAG: OmpA family protein [Bacteroidota bacterium]|nr:OmpA family protein [Candidatus Kapabacteria bacterium]MCS7303003.1 OmpA family protein [Candidatus Kapabacteria bacterium]MDW8075129.1 OmpA family protein [Bacteroidota bacterium]